MTSGTLPNLQFIQSGRVSITLTVKLRGKYPQPRIIAQKLKQGIVVEVTPGHKEMLKAAASTTVNVALRYTISSQTTKRPISSPSYQLSFKLRTQPALPSPFQLLELKSRQTTDICLFSKIRSTLSVSTWSLPTIEMIITDFGTALDTND